MLGLPSGAQPHAHHVHPICASSSWPIVPWAPFHRWGSRGLRGFCKRSGGRLGQAGGRPPAVPSLSGCCAS